MQIDIDVVQNLTPGDTTVENFLCLGDRAALTQYCRKSKSAKRESAKNAQKRSCYERIRQKLRLASGNLSDRETEDEEEDVSKAKNCVGTKMRQKLRGK